MNTPAERDMRASHLIPIFYDECRKGIASNKAPGPDELQGELIRHMPNEMHELIKKAFLRFWREGKTPNTWKVSHPWMLHKKGDPTKLKNWRPITLTNVIYKMWTNVVARMMSEYAEQVGMFTDAQ